MLKTSFKYVRFSLIAAGQIAGEQTATDRITANPSERKRILPLHLLLAT